MEIDGFDINKSCMIIAELSANHVGNKEVAKKTIRAAKKAGADAIKFQTFTPDTITINCDNDYFKIKGDNLWSGRNLYELYQEAYTPWEWHAELFEEARGQGLICFSSPFDKTAVDFLEGLEVPAYKIASFEIQDIPLIEYAASKGKPIIISTGIATEEDIELAVKTCLKAGNKNIVLLKCTSAYPAPLELANLSTIPNMKVKFDVEVGLSDHTLGIIAPTVAVSLGARVIEKHFILSKDLGGPDVKFSLDPDEFREMVNCVRDVEKALGEPSYELHEKVKENRQFSRSLFVVEDIKEGETLTNKNVRSIRPGFGLHPKYYSLVIGKKAVTNLDKGTPLQWDHLENN